MILGYLLFAGSSFDRISDVVFCHCCRFVANAMPAHLCRYSSVFAVLVVEGVEVVSRSCFDMSLSWSPTYTSSLVPEKDLGKAWDPPCHFSPWGGGVFLFYLQLMSSLVHCLTLLTLPYFGSSSRKGAPSCSFTCDRNIRFFALSLIHFVSTRGYGTWIL